MQETRLYLLKNPVGQDSIYPTNKKNQVLDLGNLQERDTTLVIVRKARRHEKYSTTISATPDPINIGNYVTFYRPDGRLQIDFDDEPINLAERYPQVKNLRDLPRAELREFLKAYEQRQREHLQIEAATIEAIKKGNKNWTQEVLRLTGHHSVDEALRTASVSDKTWKLIKNLSEIYREHIAQWKEYQSTEIAKIGGPLPTLEEAVRREFF